MKNNKNITEPTGLIKGAYINPTKNVPIYRDENGATPSSYDTHVAVTGNEHFLLAESVRTELVHAFMKLQTIMASQPELVNPELEITEDGNFEFVKNFTRVHKEAIMRSLDETIKRIGDQTDFQSVRYYDDSSISQLIAHLFGRYTARCSRATKEETLQTNKCLKMLLELKVKNLIKTNGFNVD